MDQEVMVLSERVIPEGIIVDIQRFSLHDGPGIRTVIFFKGCPLNCLWCQNPEAIDPRPELGWRESRCVKCGACAKICPEGAIRGTGKNLRKPKCQAPTGCTRCVEKCPSGALEIAGQRYIVEKLLEVVLQDKEYYANSGGGVTCSGGEPTFQWQFVHTFLKSCKEKSISTAIETCGHFGPAIVPQLCDPDTCDYILFDIKHLDSNSHAKFTGQPNTRILENLKTLVDISKRQETPKLIVRMPLIPTLNDSPDHLRAVETLLTDLGQSKLVLLPYHSLYLQKFDQFHLKRKRLAIAPLDQSRIEAIKKNFSRISVEFG
jgi:pyruvate formate lyase activating enzyme